jgi:predicted nuclease of restriction endonuclease-like (RecB) superfamily
LWNKYAVSSHELEIWRSGTLKTLDGFLKGLGYLFEGGAMKKTLPGDKTVMKRYGDLLADIKTRIRQAQNRAVMSVNAEMIRLYWDIGQMVAKRQGLEGWGKGLLRRLATDIKDEIPEIKGFSERNLQLMIQFQREYPDLFAIPQRPVAELPETSLPKEIRPQPVAEIDPTNSIQPPQASGETQIMQRIVAQLPWAHNVILIQKLKDLHTRLWYARQAIAQGWSRDTLALMIKSHGGIRTARHEQAHRHLRIRADPGLAGRT